MRAFWLAALSCVLVIAASAQSKEIFRDADGNLISNNEFVDIRMANPSYPDATIVRVLEGGIKEFRLQKVPQEGMAAPVFSLKTIDGRKLSSEELRGKVVVLHIWFIGCPACYRQETVMNEIKARFEGLSDVVFAGVTEDRAASVRDYVRNRPSLFMHVADGKAIVDAFRTPTFPRCVVIGRDGRIVYWRSTVHAKDKFESVIRAELAK
jgi:peroxiredoxin